jgi:hypothetical protein
VACARVAGRGGGTKSCPAPNGILALSALAGVGAAVAADARRRLGERYAADAARSAAGVSASLPPPLAGVGEAFAADARRRLGEWYAADAARSATGASASSPPPPRCSFDVDGRCRHAVATLACADCAPYDALQRAGYYCDGCHAARHPPCRLAHRVMPLRPPPPPPRDPTDPLHPAVRGVAELLAAARASDAALGPPAAARLAALAAAKASTDRLLSRLVAGVSELRDDATRERAAAARKIQGLYRRRSARRLMVTSARLLWGRVLDPVTGRHYYVHRVSGARQWEPPVVFGRRLDVGLYPTVLASALSPDQAAAMIQAAWRGAAGRRSILGLARCTYRRVIDGASQREFYYNLATGRSRWSRPLILAGIDLPAYSHESLQEDVAWRARAALTAQRAWRAHAARRALASRASRRWERVWDPVQRRCFYYDTAAQTSSWAKPLARALPAWQPPRAPLEPLSPEQAAAVVGRFMRMCRVRWRLQPAAARLYACRRADGAALAGGTGSRGSTPLPPAHAGGRRTPTPTHRHPQQLQGAVCYVHRPSGRASWERPALLLPTTRLPVEGGGGGAAGAPAAGTPAWGCGGTPSSRGRTPSGASGGISDGFVTVRGRHETATTASLFAPAAVATALAPPPRHGVRGSPAALSPSPLRSPAGSRVRR